MPPRSENLTAEEFLLFSQVPHALVTLRSEKGETVWSSPLPAEWLHSDGKGSPLVRVAEYLTSEVTAVREAMVQHVHDSRVPVEFLQVLRGRCCFTLVSPVLSEKREPWVGIFVCPIVGPLSARWKSIQHLAPPDLGRLSRFSPRELEVLWYLPHGRAVKEVAGTMFRSIKTVENHVSSIHRALGVQSRAELVREAVERGLTAVDLPTWLAIAGVSSSTNHRDLA